MVGHHTDKSKIISGLQADRASAGNDQYNNASCKLSKRDQYEK